MNHDIKFLSAGEGIEKAYYMMKYTTKAKKESKAERYRKRSEGIVMMDVPL
ncbi:hypothetical protein PPTG_24201 [Phytophthora nicotianae INRA-310]|uniref:Uncharacterized protein n=1 Tax=Phytophthora nicotianae (strain INRA-310) TaxID=761204 RepID=W2PL43_PHYN3|nr:hypothetical protein PPTG_24201 [Phytophthora nicotianae INRA-310]ETN00755.1 hypothetical protein PPTG_24201 [Phytophthora nicotianae INRA-310]